MGREAAGRQPSHFNIGTLEPSSSSVATPMLKRFVREAVSGFSSSGEQDSRATRAAATRRRAREASPLAPTSESESVSKSGRRGRGRERGAKEHESEGSETAQSLQRAYTSEDGATTSDHTVKMKEDKDKDKVAKSSRLTRANRRKREPLLELHVVEAVHGVFHGTKKKKRARQTLEELFSVKDAGENGTIAGDAFKKYISKVGIKLKRSSDYDALMHCFRKQLPVDSESDSDDENPKRMNDQHAEKKTKAKASVLLIDYRSFLEFACNVRDSETLGAIAEKMRARIKKYDGKQDSSRTKPFNLYTTLKKLDKSKRGWIASNKFEEFIANNEHPPFRLKSTEVDTLVERFEYEYGKGDLGIDYKQLAQWLQPGLHMDKKELHSRVSQLVLDAQDVGGWDLSEMFGAMDEDEDGYIAAAELKDALLEMGLPLTDAQIRCLVEEYDTNEDGKIDYGEFMSLFPRSSKHNANLKQKKQQSDITTDGETDGGDQKDRRRPGSGKSGKKNVRNSFSWGIAKAFARKHAVQAARGKASKSAKAIKRKMSSDSSHSQISSSPSLEDDKAEGRARKPMKKSRQVTRRDSFSGDSSEAEEIRTSKTRDKKRRLKVKTRRPPSSSERSDSSEQPGDHRSTRANETKTRRARNPKANTRRVVQTSTESEDKATQFTGHRKRCRRTQRTDSIEDDKVIPSSETSSSPPVKAKPREVRGARASTRRPSNNVHSAKTSRLERDSRARSRSRSRHINHSRNAKRKLSAPLNASDQNARTNKDPRNAGPMIDTDEASTSTAGSPASRTRNRHHVTTQLSDSPSGLDIHQVRRIQSRSKGTSRRTSSRRRRGNARGAKGSPRNEGKSSSSSTENNSISEVDDAEGESESSIVVRDSPSDTEYTKHLKKSLRRAFDFFDLDHSATIEKKELEHVLCALGHEFTHHELDREMARADLDKNGRLDFHEFVRFIKNQLAQKAFWLSSRREMEIRQAFQLLDSDGDGNLDEKQFEYLIFKILQVELTVEEHDALLDCVDKNGDGMISEVVLIAFMKSMNRFYKQGVVSAKKLRRVIKTLDEASRLTCSAMKKLLRGAPIDLDRDLLVFFGIPSNYRPAVTSSKTCRSLVENTMEHVLAFPCPETTVALAEDPADGSVRRNAATGGGMLNFLRKGGDADEIDLRKQAESSQAHAIVSLKRATGVPKPFDTREDDVVKRCVHVCLFQEHEVKRESAGSKCSNPSAKKLMHADGGWVVGNIHEIPVYWSSQEEDVWEFSKKATKEDKYKFLVRTNTLNDQLYLLVEFIVHLRVGNDEQDHYRHSHRRHRRLQRRSVEDEKSNAKRDVREMVACWCKIPVRDLLAKRLDVYRNKEKLWGGTALAPIDIEQDEVLQRRSGWRAIMNAFKKPAPPMMGIKSALVDTYPEAVKTFVRKMPPLIIAPYVALPVLAEYMAAMQDSLLLRCGATSALSEPVLKLLPKIVDDHEALSVFRRAFDAELNGTKPPQERQAKFQALVLRMWPSFIDVIDSIPSSVFQYMKPTPTRRMSLLAPTPTASPLQGTANPPPPEQEARTNLLQCTAQGQLRLADMSMVAAAPFHVREIAFEQRL